MMNSHDAKELCTGLMKADSEEEVIKLLKEAGYWDDDEVWRDYGDQENNYSSAGNQASEAEAALVEKLTNARDSLLMNACLEKGIDPEGPKAPKTLKDAVARFFERNPDTEIAGHIREWSKEKRRKVALDNTLAVTGARPRDGAPCITVSDRGEGQTPGNLPSTILSLKESIKMRIPFVHGRFNMGGTAALRFCGEHNFQFVMSRRNPKLIKNPLQDDSDKHWGFTIVRRFRPPAKGNRVSSIYRYLAPVGARDRPKEGDVLNFLATSMPIFPEGQDAYSRESEWGTLIKLYEYQTRYKTKAVMKDGLLYPLALRLPDIGLPVRVYDCRESYKGHGGSHETTLSGLKVRLHDDRGKNLEKNYPTNHPLRIDGNPVTVTVYAFKEGKARTYRNVNQGILFILNGQTQHTLHERFFARKKVKMSYLRDSLLVIVDCSQLSNDSQEKLFMNSRDRVSSGDLTRKIEQSLEELIAEHQGLKDLREKRKREKKRDRLGDSKPLEKALKSLITQSPTLSHLFLDGKRLANPFKTAKAQQAEVEYVGEKYPTFFKLKKVDYGTVFRRECRINKRCRISFETDAVNDYFDRETDPGTFSLYFEHGDGELSEVQDYRLNLYNGVGTLNVELPANCEVGDDLSFLATATDPLRIINDPFENRFELHVLEAVTSSSGESRERKRPGGGSGKDRDVLAGLQMPDVTEVYENPEDDGSSWQDVPNGPFDKYSALRVIDGGSDTSEDGSEYAIYDFYLNMDNIYLNSELKDNSRDADIITSRFKYGMILVGLALLHQENEASEDDDSNHSKNGQPSPHGTDDLMSIEERVDQFTRAASMVLLPIIEELSDVDLQMELADTE